MTAPRIPFFLALAGALPLVYAALLNMGLPPVAELQPWLPYWDDGAGLMLNYGRIILVFMAGVLWGFATLSTGKMTLRQPFMYFFMCTRPRICFTGLALFSYLIWFFGGCDWRRLGGWDCACH
jgi:hypothetical protein